MPLLSTGAYIDQEEAKARLGLAQRMQARYRNAGRKDLADIEQVEIDEMERAMAQLVTK